MAITTYSDGTYTKGDGKLYRAGIGVVGTVGSTNASRSSGTTTSNTNKTTSNTSNNTSSSKVSYINPTKSTLESTMNTSKKSTSNNSSKKSTSSNTNNSTNAYLSENGVKSDGSYLDSTTGRYYTTVTNADGTKQDGYIDNGTTYYSNGTPISAGASVTDSTGKTWTKGSTDSDAGLSTEQYLSKYGVSGASSNAYNTTPTYTYGDISTESVKTNPYQELYEKQQEEYQKQQDLIKEQNALAVQQGVQRLENQKTNINDSANENARQAYVQYMQDKKALPQQLAYQGVNGGATETANLGLATNYQNNVYDINKNKANQIQEIDNAIVDLQNTGDLTTVEQVLANNQEALNAYTSTFNNGVSYNQWANEYNANRADTAYEQAYKTQAYQDSLAQQAYEQYQSEREALTKSQQEEYDNIMNLYLKGALDVNYAASLLGIDADALSDLKTMAEEEAALNNAQTQASINNTNSTIAKRNSGSSSSSSSSSSESGATTAQVNTVAANVSKMLGETEDVFGDGSITRAKYGTEDLLAYIESTGLSDEQKYQMEVSFGLI